jgi:hypothetical protein
VKFSVFFLLFLYVFPGKGQIIFYDTFLRHDAEELKIIYQRSLHLLDSIQAAGFRVHRVEIVELKQSLFMVIDGRMDVYRWSNDNSWYNISKSKYHGYNFFSKKFIYNDELYSYGGYGFWREHGDIIKFDWAKNEWETILINSKEDFGYNTSFVRDSILYIINPVSRNQHIGQIKVKNYLIGLNLNSKHIDKYQITISPDELKNTIRLETNNYYLVSNYPVQFINKSTLRYKSADISMFDKLYEMNERSFVVVSGDSVLFWADNFVDTPVLYDLASDYQNFQTSEDRIVKSYSFIYSGILALLSISLALFIYKKRSNRKFKKEIQYDHPLIHKILSTGKQQLSQEEIDGIFGRVPALQKIIHYQ